MLKGVSLTDRIEVPTSRQLTDAGQMIVPCAFARVGAQPYTAGQLGLTDKAADEIVMVMRDEADVFAEDSLATFRSAPVTIGHPKNEDGSALLVDSDNAGKLQVGMLEGLPTRDEELLTGTLVIAQQDAIDLIDEGTVELSAGYTCDLDVVVNDAGETEIYQRNIKANHIAIVAKGRAGSSCRIADEADEAVVEAAAAKAAESMAVEDEVETPAPDAEPVVEPAAEPVVEDEVVLTDTELLAKADAKLVVLADEVEALKAVTIKLQDEINAGVNERVEVILVARDLTDLEDFAEKSVDEIKKLVVADQLPKLDLEGKDEAYVAARFDILSEDAEIDVTPMGKLIADNSGAVHATEAAKPSTVVADARQKMIDRGKR